MVGLRQDLGLAWRGMARAPGFAALVIATMALGIGANTAMFSVIRAVLLRPLPYPNQDRLVTLWERDAERGIDRRSVTPANFVDWEAQSDAFEEMGALPNWSGRVSPFNVVAQDGSMERVPGVYASSGFFRVLGVPPLLGRTFGREEDTRAGEQNIVISHSYWRQRFAGDPAAVGADIEVDTFRGGSFTVIGVMPEGFEFPRGARVWLSLGDWGAGPMPPPDAPDRCCSWYTVFARLKPGMTAESAGVQLTAIARRISQRHPQAARVTEVQVMPLRDSLVGTQRPTLLALFGAVGCILLIGCANVANLLLSRGVARRQEMLTRMALGATRWRLARQATAEALFLTVLGAVAGVAAASWVQGLLVRALQPRAPLAEGAQMDWAVLGFAVLLAMACGVACGLAPLAEWRTADWSRRGQTEGGASKRLREFLVVGEVALALSLVASAGLLARTVAKLQSVELGFRFDRILAVSLDLGTRPLRGRGNAARFVEELMPRVAALPGVRAAAATNALPLENGRAGQAITREGRPALPAADSPQVVQRAVTPGYFTAMGIPLRKGRLFTEADTGDGNLVAIVNETAARRYWPGEDPVGTRFAVGSLERFGSFRRPPPGGVELREIVGVVADVRTAGFAAEVQPEVYYSYKQYPLYDVRLLVWAAVDPTTLAPVIRREAAAVNPRAVVARVRTMEEVAAASLAEPRQRAALVGVFSALALGLGMLGIYSVMSYTVARRTKEIGIRVALGAQPGDVLRLVVGQALRLAAAGVIVGLAGAVAAGRWISGLLFGVQPGDPATLAGTCLLLAGAAVAASYRPARHAARVDPAVALRSEP
jgi:predicted permease